MKLYIISGEASGDLHGSNLIKAIKKNHPNTLIRAWGGDLMRNAGADVVKDYRELAFMGFSEVVMNLRTIFRNIDYCKKDILAFKPDTIVLIDYPGFNLRIAEWAKKEGFRVVYYISPQIWAWKQGRIKKIKAYVDEMCVVLPFEKDFYARFNMDVHFVGHPLLDEIKEIPEKDRKKQIALLPGSRKQEINAMLPLMLKVASNFKDYEVVIAGAPGQSPEFYEPFITGSNVKLVFGKTYEILKSSAAGLVTSGTATLEAGLFKMPQVVCYKGSTISYWIARQLVKIKYISLVNLILDKPSVKELIQHDFNEKTLHEELEKLLFSQEKRNQLDSDYQALYEKLGGGGASEKTANVVLKSTSVN